MSIYITSVLSVSRKHPINCDEIAKDLHKIGIYTSVVKNTTYTDTKEYGCRLTQTVTKKKELVGQCARMRRALCICVFMRFFLSTTEFKFRRGL